MLTTDAANEPFNHLLLWLISSAACSGTSVSALLGLTYCRTHFSPFFATSSKQRMLQGRCLSLSTLTEDITTYRSSAKNMFLVKMPMPYIPFLPSLAATINSSSVNLVACYAKSIINHSHSQVASPWKYWVKGRPWIAL